MSPQLPLPLAVKKMTSMPADRLGLRDRGRLQPGCRADIAVFSPEKFSDQASFAEPHRPANGMHRLLLNGKTVLAEGAEPVFGCGSVLRAG